MHQDLDQVTERVEYDVALASLRLLVAVIAPIGRLDALRIDNAVTRSGSPAVFFGAFRPEHPAFFPRPRVGFTAANGHRRFARAGSPWAASATGNPSCSGRIWRRQHTFSYALAASPQVAHIGTKRNHSNPDSATLYPGDSVALLKIQKIITNDRNRQNQYP
jgi:hypothetical protein